MKENPPQKENNKPNKNLKTPFHSTCESILWPSHHTASQNALQETPEKTLLMVNGRFPELENRMGKTGEIWEMLGNAEDMGNAGKRYGKCWK